MTAEPALARATFRRLSTLLRCEAGIYLADHETTLAVTRLAPRLRALGLSDFDAYGRGLEQGAWQGELQHFVDRLTTNETYFFRELSRFTPPQRAPRRGAST